MKQLTNSLLDHFGSLKRLAWWWRPRKSARSPRRQVPLRLQHLEDRCVPATSTWTGAINNDWDNPGNWMGGVPGDQDEAVLNANVSCTVNATVEVKKLDMRAGFNGATLTVANGNTLTSGLTACSTRAGT